MALLVAGGLLAWGSAYVHNTVQGQLAAQQISFPPAAAFAHPKAGTEITPSMIPSVSQYAGQQMLTGQQAEAYADHFIAVHIANMAGGKTYSQLSAEAIAQPSNTQLAGTVATVFKGETLRSMLLNAYGWWQVSQITCIIALAAFGLGTLSFLAGLLVSPASATTASWPPRRPRSSSRSMRPATRRTPPPDRPGPPRAQASAFPAPATGQGKRVRCRLGARRSGAGGQ